MAKYLKRHEGIEVSHGYMFVADLWREHRLKPCGTLACCHRRVNAPAAEIQLLRVDAEP